jgi:hypothetical protein
MGSFDHHGSILTKVDHYFGAGDIRESKGIKTRADPNPSNESSRSEAQGFDIEHLLMPVP